GQKLHHRKRSHRLARARLADQRHRLAHADGKRDAVDRQRFLAAMPKRDREIVDLEELVQGGVFVVHVNAFRGSKASRTASPMKINSDSMMATEKNPASPSQGA